MLRVLLTLEALADLAYGLILLIAPVPFLALYGPAPDATGTFVARFLGGALVGWGVLVWLARDLADEAARRAVVLALFVSSFLGFLAALLDQLSGRPNALGWTTVVFTAFFALGFGYFTTRAAAHGSGRLR
jgi:hypothetical protein